MTIPFVFKSPFAIANDPNLHDWGVLTALPNGELVALGVAEINGSDPLLTLCKIDTLYPGVWDEVGIAPNADYIGWYNFSIVALSNGSLVRPLTSSVYNPQSGTGVFFDMFSPDGSPIGSVHPVNSVTGRYSAHSDIIALPGGGFMVGYEEANPTGVGTTYNRNVYAHAYLADGTSAGAAFLLNQFTDGDQSSPMLAMIGSDRFVAIWTDERHYYADGPSAFYGRVFALDGTPLTADFAVDLPTGSESGVSVTGLSTGQFVVTWHQNISSDPFTGVIVRIFNPDGTAVSGEIVVSPGSNRDQTNPTVAPLLDGRFLVAWTENWYNDKGASNSWTVARILNPDGSFDDVPFLAAPGDASHTMNPSAVTLVDGRVAISWVQQDSEGMNDYNGWILDPRIAGVNVAAHGTYATLVGTEYGDTLVGASGPGGDWLAGYAGNDRIVGDAGNDTLWGDDGADTLNGGTGDDFIFGGYSEVDLRDLIYGGDGNDSISSDFGNDLVYSSAGNDTVDGGVGADEVLGQDGADLLSGGAMSDLIYGGADSDFINGGFGFDRLNGGAGADRFYHQGAAGHGLDWIQDYSFADGDRLVFGAAATRDQFLVQTAETANAGQAGVSELFVTYVPTGQILWALVDGAAQEGIVVQAGNQVFDLIG